MRTLYVKIKESNNDRREVITHIHPSFEDVYERAICHIVDHNGDIVSEYTQGYTHIKPKVYTLPITDMKSTLKTIYDLESYTGLVKFMVCIDDTNMECHVVSSENILYRVNVNKINKSLAMISLCDINSGEEVFSKVIDLPAWRELDDFDVLSAISKFDIISDNDRFVLNNGKVYTLEFTPDYGGYKICFNREGIK